MNKFLTAWAAMAALMLAAPPGRAQSAGWNPQPWLEDLAQARAAIETKYANLEWLLTEREYDLEGLFRRAEAAIRGAGSDAQAMAVFNRLAERIDDGHVYFSWPSPAAPPAAPNAAAAPPPPTPESFCRARGYDARSVGIGPRLNGAAPLASTDPFPGVMVPIGEVRAGMIRIDRFDPHGSLLACTEAVSALPLPLDGPCDESCDDRLITEAYRRFTLALEAQIERLRAGGATVLIVDLTGNGGGSEWAEAAARMLTPRTLVSEPRGFVRGPHWAGIWSRLADRLRGFARTAPAQDRRRLLAWAAEADAARAEAERTCPPTGGCSWLGRAGFATGLIGEARAGAFAGREWAPWIFSPAQYPYRDGVWDGPLIVLVDQNTASAAEQFAALLQDNRAALVVGARTAGAGCGHSWGGTPTRLSNSGATLHVPDCARFRADGSNEVRGIMPDVLIGWRANDGPGFRAGLLEAALPEAIARAAALHHAPPTSR